MILSRLRVPRSNVDACRGGKIDLSGEIGRPFAERKTHLCDLSTVPRREAVARRDALDFARRVWAVSAIRLPGWRGARAGSSTRPAAAGPCSLHEASRSRGVQRAIIGRPAGERGFLSSPSREGFLALGQVGKSREADGTRSGTERGRVAGRPRPDDVRGPRRSLGERLSAPACSFMRNISSLARRC